MVLFRADGKASGKIANFEDNRGNEPERTLPYPEALKNAAIKTDKLNSPVLDGMIQGNGDLHSFFYAKTKQIILRLAKNDIYDARIETKDDPGLARIDIATGKTSRKLTLPPSWEKPYPLSINFVNVVIDFSGRQNTEIDIMNSCANINDGEILIRPSQLYMKFKNKI
jgi:hypothetical protein